MSAPTTSIDSGTGNVVITWTAPSANGQPITSYIIKIKDSSGTPHTELTDCDGSQNAILTARSCSIPMSTLWASPFTLA
jgi:hypothetical protein